jgi:uncharacterized protein
VGQGSGLPKTATPRRGRRRYLKSHYIVFTIEKVALRFDWDDRKNAQNRRKHGISFEEAQPVFLDEHALLISDPDHSDNEDRLILLGLSSALRLLLVCHCYRRRGEVVRIISARRANRQEHAQYGTRWIQ